MAVGLRRSGDLPAARHIGRCAAPPANHRWAAGLLPLPREEFRQFKLILHSELRRRAASRRALPFPSSFSFFCVCKGCNFLHFWQLLHNLLANSVDGVWGGAQSLPRKKVVQLFCGKDAIWLKTVVILRCNVRRNVRRSCHSERLRLCCMRMIYRVSQNKWPQQCLS